MKVTLWPMNTLSSMSTPSQTKVWLEILQQRPTRAFFWISTNAPILVSSPISHPYRLMNWESLTFRPSFTEGAIQANSLTTAPPRPGCERIFQRLPGFGQRPGPLLRRQRAFDILGYTSESNPSQPTKLQSAPPAVPTCRQIGSSPATGGDCWGLWTC